MKRAFLPIAALALLAIIVAGCGKSPGVGNNPTSAPGGTGGGGNEVQMAATNFVQSTLTVHAGDTVKFVDPSGTGGYHVLCFGHNQVCQSNPNGPADLNTSAGVTFNQGDTKSYTFATAGTFEVTCTVHPNMNVTITVQ